MHATLLLVVAMVTTAAEPERVLLLQDPQSASLEQVAVHHTLLQNLLADPGVDVFVDHPFSPGLRRAVTLRQQADLSLATARRALQALNPALAADNAGAAAQKFQRLAALTGDVTPLSEALGLQATAYLWLKAHGAAERVLQRLLSLDPDYRPDPALYNPGMQRRFAAARQRASRRPRRMLTVQTQPLDAAIFLDGRFLGFGSGQAEVVADAQHYVVAMAEGYGPRAQAIGHGHVGAGAPPGRLDLLPDARAQPASYQHLIAASQRTTAFPDPSAPILRAWSIDTVLVLAYDAGALQLTAFDMRQGQRRATHTAVAVTDLRDAAAAAEKLIANAPPLALVPAAAKQR